MIGILVLPVANSEREGGGGGGGGGLDEVLHCF